MKGVTVALADIHRVLASVLWPLLLALSLWGGYRAVRKQGVESIFMRALMVGVILLIVQAIVGVVLWIGVGLPGGGWAHILLGALASIFLFGINAILRGDLTSQRAPWTYATGTLLLVGVVLLAVSTG